MAVYLEPVAVTADGRRISRLRADSVPELDAFVAASGITAPCAVHATVPGMTHYELSWRERRRALRTGAQQTDWGETYQRLARLILDDGEAEANQLRSHERDTGV